MKWYWYLLAIAIVFAVMCCVLELFQVHAIEVVWIGDMT